MKKGFLIILLLIIFLTLAASVQAKTEPLVRYPGIPFARAASTIVPYLDLPGAEDPTAGIPQYIRYIFIFSLGVVGIIAFISMLVAAFGYVTSVGNPQKATAAKDRIFSALLGILLLFGSYLLLNTINPDLLKFKITGEKVDIPVTGEQPREGCQYTSAEVKPGTVDVSTNESIYTPVVITLERVNCKDNEWEDHKIELELKQAGNDCPRIINDMQTNNNEAAEWKGVIYLNQRCRPCHLWAPPKNPIVICNTSLKEPETFILKGKIELSHRIQYIPEIKITARDLTEDGLCCR